MTLPPAPSPTETRLGTVSPLTQLRLDAVGSDAPVGKTVKKPAVVSSTAVTLRITEVALEGTLMPPMARSRLPPGPSLPPLGRVSSRRSGVLAVYTVVGFVV